MSARLEVHEEKPDLLGLMSGASRLESSPKYVLDSRGYALLCMQALL